MVFVLFSVVIFVFIIIIAYSVSNSGNSGPESVEEPAPSGDDFTDGNVAFIFSVAGINMNQCSDKHVGTFFGYLKAEPDNPYDAKAIAVIHSDGSKLGYIKAVETDKVRMLLSDRLDNWPIVGDIINVGHYVCHIYVESNPLADHEDL